MRTLARVAAVVAALVGCLSGTAIVAAVAGGRDATAAVDMRSRVPSQLGQLIAQEATRYCWLPPELLAAVLDVESGFRNDAVSPEGAVGMGQFMPDTWRAWGVDANGDGTANPRDEHDAIASTARYLCALGAEDPAGQRNAVAAYNAGPAAVRRHRGVPPYPETRAYIERVFARAASVAGSGGVVTEGSAAGADRVIEFAVSKIGTPYRWGGDGRDGFYDCSGLTLRAFEHAGVRLPRTAAAQYQATPPVDAASLQPGDLLFWAHDTANPATIHHVAIYLGVAPDGRDRMIDAPHTGATIQIRPVHWSGFLGATRPLEE